MSLANAAVVAGEDVVYQLNPVNPPLDPAVVDSGEAALEIVILWGEHSILHVAHLSPPRAFYVGDAVDAQGKHATDFLIGSESLGSQRLPIVVEQGSRVAIVIPAGAVGDVTIDGHAISFEELAAHQQLSAAGAEALWAPDAALFTLPLGAAVRVSHHGFTFIAKQTSAARRIGAGERVSAKRHAWTFASMLLHASLLIAFQLLPPHSSGLSLELLNADSRLVSFQSEAKTAEEPDQTPSWVSGEREQGDEGQMGEATQQKTQNKLAVRGERRDADPPLTRAEAEKVAASAGIIGILKASTGAAPTSIFGRESASGDNSFGAAGAIFGDQVGANFGFGGLGLHGHGRGGGGNGEGTAGVGELGTLGHGRGDEGYGSGAGGIRTHTAKVPHIRSAAADVHGSLSKEVIRRVIGRHVSEVRFCYEQALTARPDLQGRVTVKLIIAPTGAVQAAAVDNSELGNLKAEQCIAAAVRRWVFPAPEGGGIVVVNYPFVLSQSGD